MYNGRLSDGDMQDCVRAMPVRETHDVFATNGHVLQGTIVEWYLYEEVADELPDR